MSSISQSRREQSTQQQSTSTQTPWAPQATGLEFAFNAARDAFGKANNAQAPDSFVAQLTPQQRAVFDKMIGMGDWSAPGQTAATGTDLTNMGVGATRGVLSDLGAFTPKGGTQYNIDAATQYANNPSVDGMVQAAMRDATRSVNEQALPGIAREAAATGNLNSSRRAIQEGIIQRGLAEKTADVSSNLRGQLYSSGLDLAQNEANSSNNTILDAMRARAGVGSDATSQGLGATNASIGQAGGLFDIASKGVTGAVGADQANLDNQASRYSFQVSSPFDALNQYWNILGSGNWGGTTTTQGTSNTQQVNTPSMMDTIGRAVSTAGAIGGWFKSDRRVKTDIEPVGETYNGLTLYRFRYRGDDDLHIGLMAQDVAEVFPEAVREVNGIKEVNYDLALQS